MPEVSSYFLKNRVLLTTIFVVIYFCANAWVESISTLTDFQRMGLKVAIWEPYSWAFSSAFMLLLLIAYVIMANERHPLKYSTFAKHLGFHVMHSVVFSVIHVLGMVSIRKAVYFFHGTTYEFGHWPSELLYEYRKDILTYFFILSAIYVYHMVIRQLQGDASLVEERTQSSDKSPNKLLVKKKGKEFIIDLSQISRIESGGNYVYIHSNKQVYPMRSTMNKMIEHLNNELFVRVHRSYIINTDYIKEIISTTPQEYQIMMTDGVMVPLSRKNRPLLLSRFHS